MKPIRILFIIFFVALTCSKGFGQQELGLHLMPRAIQSQWTNPAHYHPYRLNIALPGLYIQGIHTGFTYRDLVQPKPGTDSLELNVDQAISAMRDQNDIRINGAVEAFALSFRIVGIQFMLGARERFNASVTYPKSLMQFAWEGNQQSIGETIDLAPNFSVQSYHEFSLGVTYPLTDKIRIGARGKYLVGLADISVANSRLDLTTNAEYYQLAADLDYEIRMSQISIGDLDEPTPEVFVIPFSQNRGMAFDVGVQAELNKRFQVNASILDLGSIKWSEEARTYRAQGTVQFSGLDAMALVEDDSFDVDELVDSLTSDISLTEEVGSYSTTLPTQIYLSGVFRPIKSLRLSLTGHAEHYQGTLYPSLGIGASKDLGRILTVGATYGIRNGRADNLGANLLVKFGPVMFFATTDNLLTYFRPEHAQLANLRLGLNLCFGRKKK